MEPTQAPAGFRTAADTSPRTTCFGVRAGHDLAAVESNRTNHAPERMVH